MSEITCIVCPLGCRISVERQGQEFIIKGQGCNRGAAYARNEVTVPTRIVTSVVTVAGSHQLLPVKTAAPVPKEKIRAVIAEIQEIKVVAPLKTGQILRENIAATGVSLVATKNCMLREAEELDAG